ncbi:6653_t:CDS:2, partial [Rhizophagus irregularis]
SFLNNLSTQQNPSPLVPQFLCPSSILGGKFLKSPNLVIASEKAIRIIAYLNKSMARLHDEQKINILNILRYFFHWNSHYYWYFSLLQTKSDLKENSMAKTIRKYFTYPECDIESSREWRNLIKEWIEMVDEDEKINQTDEENSENLEPLINRVMNLDQILCKKHTKMLNGS